MIKQLFGRFKLSEIMPLIFNKNFRLCKNAQDLIYAAVTMVISTPNFHGVEEISTSFLPVLENVNI